MNYVARCQTRANFNWNIFLVNILNPQCNICGVTKGIRVWYCQIRFLHKYNEILAIRQILWMKNETTELSFSLIKSLFKIIASSVITQRVITTGSSIHVFCSSGFNIIIYIFIVIDLRH